MQLSGHNLGPIQSEGPPKQITNVHIAANTQPYLQLKKKSRHCPLYYVHVYNGKALSQLGSLGNNGGGQLTSFISLKKEVQNNQSEKEERLKRMGEEEEERREEKKKKRKDE